MDDSSLIYIVVVFAILDVCAYFRLRKNMKDIFEDLRSHIGRQEEEIRVLRKTLRASLKETDVKYYAEEYVNEFGSEEEVEPSQADYEFDARVTLPQAVEAKKCPNPCKKPCGGRKCP